MGLCLGLMMNRLSPINNLLRILILIPWTIPILYEKILRGKQTVDKNMANLLNSIDINLF